MKKQTKKHNPSFSFHMNDRTTARFEVFRDRVDCTFNCKLPDGSYDFKWLQGNALDVIANLRQAADEIERMYFEQEGK